MNLPSKHCRLILNNFDVPEHMSSGNKVPCDIVKKASHLSRCVKGTLRNIKNVVGNFVTCTDGHKGGFQM